MLSRSWELWFGPSVCQSGIRVLCGKTKQFTADILIPHERAITLVFWRQQWLVGDAPFRLNFAFVQMTYPFEKRRRRQVSIYRISTQKTTKKFNYGMTNTKSITGFPTSYRWSAYARYAIPKSPKGGPKSDFLFWIKLFNFNRIKSATKFYCVKLSAVNLYSIAIPPSNGL